MQCRICGNTTNNATYQAREMMYGLRETFEYFQCSACGCLQIAEIPADLIKYYPADYNGFAVPRGTYYGGPQGKFRRRRYEAALFGRTLTDRLIGTLFPAPQFRLIGKRLGLDKTTRILDVGCGRGSYLYPLYELGMTNVRGIDPFIPATIVYPNGYTVEKRFIHDMTGRWDIVMYNHSFEHVPDPLDNLLAVKRILAPGGLCIIRVPTVSSYAWEHYRTDWFQLDAPRHFFLHSVKSMELLAAQAGLHLADVVYDSSEMQFIGSEKYRQNIPLVQPVPRTNPVARKVQKWRYRRAARQLNAQQRGDQAAFLLKEAQ